MSLGGFAQGLATSFQRAEDRYQDKKARQEARAERQASQAAGQAFTMKMYTQRQRDDETKRIRDTKSYLDSVFGTDEEGKLLTASMLNMGLDASKAVIDRYETAIKGTGIDIKTLLKATNPEGTENNYQLPKFDDIQKHLVDARMGKKVDADFRLPTFTRGEIPTFAKQITGLDSLVTDDAIESLGNIEIAMNTAQANMQIGTPNERKTAKSTYELLQKMQGEEQDKVKALTGLTDVEKASMYSLTDTKTKNFKDQLFGRFQKTIKNARGEVKTVLEGNVTEILDTYRYGYENHESLTNDFRGNPSMYAISSNSFNGLYVVAGNKVLRDETAKKVNEITSKKMKDGTFQTVPQVRVDVDNYAEQAEILKNLNKGDVIRPTIMENGTLIGLPYHIISKLDRSATNNSGISTYKYMTKISTVYNK